MASEILHIPLIKTSKASHNLKQISTLSLSFSFSATHHLKHHPLHLLVQYDEKHPSSRFRHFPPKCTLSKSTPKPPTTKEEAILQATTSLASALEKPLNNPKLTGKLKKIKQPRFRLEIPVIDDSPRSLSQLALQVFGELPVRKKGLKIKILLLWPNQDLTRAASEAFGSHNSSGILVQNVDVSSVLYEDIRTVNSSDVAVFLAPQASQLGVMKSVADCLYPRPTVMFNPGWGFEEELGFGEMGGFVGSFEVLYSITGLEVRGMLSKRKGVIFTCAREGILSGERWYVFVEEGGELRVVSRFKSRPSIAEVENVLYNLMAVNSPITKSVRFLKDLVSNVTGRNK